MARDPPDPSDSSFTIMDDGSQHQDPFIQPYEFPEEDLNIIDQILNTMTPEQQATQQNMNEPDEPPYGDSDMSYGVDGGSDKRAITDGVIIGEVADDPTPKRAVFGWIASDGRIVRRPAPVTTRGRNIANCKQPTYPIHYGSAIHREKIHFIPPLQGITEDQELKWLFDAIKDPRTRDLVKVPPVFTSWAILLGLFNSTGRRKAYTRRDLKDKVKNQHQDPLDLDPMDPEGYPSLEKNKVIDLSISHPPTPIVSTNVTPSVRRKRNFDEFSSPNPVGTATLPQLSFDMGPHLFTTPVKKTTRSTRPQIAVTKNEVPNESAKYDIRTIKNRLGMSSGLDATGTSVGNDNEHGVGRLIESLGFAHNREIHYRQLLSGLLAKVVWSLEQPDHDYANQRLSDYLSTMNTQFQEAGMSFSEVLAYGEQRLSIPKEEDNSVPNL
ncbi:MAG: hypothetical protein M1819_001368 [Sarea resinae]|nr:MAG: hypothetical protein M1819_001368 [Sarea resinae]